MDFIDEIKDHAQDSDFGSKVFFSDPKYDCFELREDDFKEMSYSKNQSVQKSIKNCIFIDGGNSEIISSPSFSANLIRLGAVAYNGKQKLFAKRSQIYCLVKSIIENEKIFYEAKMINESKNNSSNNSTSINIIKIDSMDFTIREGIHRASISKVAGIVRRFAELKLACELCNKHANSIIVLDGSLQASFNDENKYLEDLYNSASKNNCLVIGLSKTNTLLTDKGWPVSFALDNKTKLPKWYFKVASSKNKDHRADIYFAKLHEKSSRAFRIDIFNGIDSIINNTNLDFSHIANSLAANSVDATFLGYPYGLVEVDKLARVSNSESDILKTRTKAKLGSKWKSFEALENNINAHDVLDRM